jgi:hypothetical protein
MKHCGLASIDILEVTMPQIGRCNLRVSTQDMSHSLPTRLTLSNGLRGLQSSADALFIFILQIFEQS